MGFSADAEVDLAKMITLLNAIHEGTLEGLLVAGNHVVDLASQLAPEDTGDLKKSGRAVLIGDAVDISFGNDLPDDRAIAQEYGTIFMPAQPYLGPALKEIDIVEEVAKSVRRRLT
jgi:hypothetical protein